MQFSFSTLCCLAAICIISLTCTDQASGCITISEVYPNTEEPGHEWIEIESSCDTTVNLSSIQVTDNVSYHYYSLYGTLVPGGKAVLANNASEFCQAFNCTSPVIDLGATSKWMNDNGDTIYVINGSIALDHVSYGVTGRNESVSLCEGEWIITEETPGSENDCPDAGTENCINMSCLTVHPQEVSFCDPVNFNLTIESECLAGYLNVSIVIGSYNAECGATYLEENSSEDMSCTWDVPCDIETDGPETFSACAYVKANGTELATECTDLVITGFHDFGDLTIDTECPETPVRFGDIVNVKSTINPGNHVPPLMVIAYVYKPKWITSDMKGDTIHSHINDTDAVLPVDGYEAGESIMVYTPMIIKDNCDGEYQDGTYTGKVRVYENVTGDVISESMFNVTVSGSNGKCCPECDKCEKTECDNSCNCGTSPPSPPTEEKSEFIELEEFQNKVAAGSTMRTSVMVKNVLSESMDFSMYSYAFNGSRCVSMGNDGTSWKKTWTANSADFSLNAGGIKRLTLENRIADDTSPGVYSFRVRLKYGDEKEDLTMSVNVTEPVREEENATTEQNMTLISGVLEEENLSYDNQKNMTDEPEFTGMSVSGDNILMQISDMLFGVFRAVSSFFKF